MSQLKTKFDTASLKAKLSNLLEKIDRNNTSKMIVERHYASLSSLEIAEGTTTAKDAYAELLGKGVEQNKARHLVTASTLSEAKTQVADSFLLGRIQILESSMKDLKAYNWMPAIKTYIEEGQAFIKENQTLILIESVIRDLELDRRSSYYTKAINTLRECSKSENPEFAITESLSSEVWIPLVKRLYEYCNSIKGSIIGTNPNFRVSKIYSPIETIDESAFLFHSSGKNIVFDGSNLLEYTEQPSEEFTTLVQLSESVKISDNEIRLYPSSKSILSINFKNETPEIRFNDTIVESNNIESMLLSGGHVKMSETGKIAQIHRAINEGFKIKDIDFGYKVTSSVYEGLSSSIFNISDRIFIQRINKAMNENSIVEADSAIEAVKIVKDFMNYDITESINQMVKTEQIQESHRQSEITKLESRVKFLIEKIAEIDAATKTLGDSEYIKEAKDLLTSELKEQNNQLSKLKGISEDYQDSFIPQVGTGAAVGTNPISFEYLVPGKEYTIDNIGGFIYTGVSDGNYIFSNNETSVQPIHMKETEIQSAIADGRITI